MTKLLEQAVMTARRMTPEMQDDIARMMMAYAGDDQQEVRLSREDEAAAEASRAAAARGEFATDEQVRELWAKHGL